MSCKRTLYKNCSCKICRKRNPAHVKIFIDRHRSPLRQREKERRTSGLIPSFETLEIWFAL